MDRSQRLEITFQLLSTVKDCYAIAIEGYLIPALPDVMDESPLETSRRIRTKQTPAQQMESKFSRTIRSAFQGSLFVPTVYQALSSVIRTECASLFKITNEDWTSHSTTTGSENYPPLKALFELCSAAGLGGRPAVQAFAIAMDGVVNEFVTGHLLEVDWVRQGSVLGLLRSWTQTALVSFVQESVAQLGGAEDLMLAKETARWQEMILKRLGEVRVAVLFDYVSLWPQSKGAFLDLRVSLEQDFLPTRLTS
jgi:hypothetical protein